MSGTHNPDYDENDQRRETLTHGRLSNVLAGQLQLLTDEELVEVTQDDDLAVFTISVGDDQYGGDQRQVNLKFSYLQDLLLEDLHLLSGEELVGVSGSDSTATFTIEQTGSE